MPCPRCQHENRPQAKLLARNAPALSVRPALPPGQMQMRRARGSESVRQALGRGVRAADRHGRRSSASISSSPIDVQPVFAAVLRSAARLCDAFDATIFQVDGNGLRLVAHDGPIPSTPIRRVSSAGNGRGTCGARPADDPRPPICRPRWTSTPRQCLVRGPTVTGQCSMFLCCAGPRPSGRSASGGSRSAVHRPASRTLETFADQAVIAIENVRLFKDWRSAIGT
jgi:hypothetical protein